MRPDLIRPRRRSVLAGALAASAGLSRARADARPDFAAIETAAGGRLGLWAGRVGEARTVAWRADERFLMCSTFKALAVSAVLARVDVGQEQLDRPIAFGPADLQDYAPVARANLAKGALSLGAWCAAAIEQSDNTAANLILAELGGPASVTTYIRRLGDTVTRLDRNEPGLNHPGPAGDDHDSTTPASMAGLWRRLLLGDGLSAASRGRLAGWLEACETAPGRLKAILPAGWRMGHKTGTGQTTLGDVAILTPPDGRAILMACYFEAPDALSHPHDDAIAGAGRIALRFLTTNA